MFIGELCMQLTSCKEESLFGKYAKIIHTYKQIGICITHVKTYTYIPIHTYIHTYKQVHKYIKINKEVR